ncbi:hypothetical protein [Azospirillum sp. sgz302134]
MLRLRRSGHRVYAAGGRHSVDGVQIDTAQLRWLADSGLAGEGRHKP